MIGPRDPGSYTLTVTEREIPRPPNLVQQSPSPPILTATPSSSALPTPSAAALTFASVSAGGEHTCGVTTSGAAYCWGYGQFGALGDGSATIDQTTPVAVSGGLTFASVSAGGSHTCGVTTSGAAYCWGEGDDGQLGNGSERDQARPVAVSGGLTFASVSAGFFHTCGVTTSGAAYCWGEGVKGQLGNGSMDLSKATPVAVSGGLAFASMSAGSSHTCGVTTSGAAYCWGYGGDGMLGDGATVRQATPGDGTIDRQLKPVAVSGGLTFASVGASGSHTCGVTTSGAAYCWGTKATGQLGDDNVADNSTTPMAVSGGLTFASVNVGLHDHTCGVTTSGAAYCWGWPSSGKLGDGSKRPGFTPMAVAPPAGGQ